MNKIEELEKELENLVDEFKNKLEEIKKIDYQEIKNENENNSKQREFMTIERGALEKHYIPKSKINKKITELNLEIEKLQIEYEKEVVFAYKEVNLGKQKLLIEKAKVLQDLLESE